MPLRAEIALADVPTASVANSRYDLLLNSYQSLVVMGDCKHIMLGHFNVETIVTQPTLRE